MDWMNISVVLNGGDLVDSILNSTTQPAAVRSKDDIQALRRYYRTKLERYQRAIHTKLSTMLEEFPRPEMISSLMLSGPPNTAGVFDMNRYERALDRLSTARGVIDGIARDYLRLIKFGDSQWRLMQLYRAALGRMFTALKLQDDSLRYLERVRQRMISSGTTGDDGDDQPLTEEQQQATTESGGNTAAIGMADYVDRDIMQRLDALEISGTDNDNDE